MADQVALEAQIKESAGSRANRRLRRTGMLPGVLYGMGEDPTPIATDYRATRAVLSTGAGLNALVNLKLDGSEQLCLVKDLQRHPVKDEVTHIDFIRVDPNAEIEVSVPLVIVGEAKEVANENGMVDQTMFSLQVYSLPTAIPNELEIDISALTVGDAVRVGQVELPGGVRTEVDAEEAIAVAVVTRSTLDAIRAEEEAAAAALLEGEEGAAPAAAAADADADGGDEG